MCKLRSESVSKSEPKSFAEVKSALVQQMKKSGLNLGFKITPPASPSAKAKKTPAVDKPVAVEKTPVAEKPAVEEKPKKSVNPNPANNPPAFL